MEKLEKIRRTWSIGHALSSLKSWSYKSTKFNMVRASDFITSLPHTYIPPYVGRYFNTCAIRRETRVCRLCGGEDRGRRGCVIFFWGWGGRGCVVQIGKSNSNFQSKCTSMQRYCCNFDMLGDKSDLCFDDRRHYKSWARILFFWSGSNSSELGPNSS